MAQQSGRRSLADVLQRGGTRRVCALLCALGASCPALRLTARPAPAPPDAPPPLSAPALPPARPPDTAAERSLRVHDPCILRDGAYYYVFSTGTGIPIRRSRDLRRWEPIGSVFAPAPPEWTRQAIPGSRGAWAPDISFAAGRFWLYYAVSRFGSNHSLIALASSRTLDPASPDYGWRDDGKVIESGMATDYNAIDPNIIRLADGRAALTFGSFFSGIKLAFVDARTGKPAPDAKVYDLAQRAAPDAVEAPFLIRRGAYYYLFVSFDFCCRGLNSTYNIRVGRSRDVTGPYTDRDGRAMTGGGGSIVLAAQGREIGPGHCAILQDGPQAPLAGGEQGKTGETTRDYLVYHFYDRDAQGASRLQIRPLTWTPDDWPLAGEPLVPLSEAQESKPNAKP